MNNEPNDPLHQSNEEFADLRLRLRGLPTRQAPAALITSLKREFVGPTWTDHFLALFTWKMPLWKPVGALAVTALLAGVWLTNWKNSEKDLLDIEPLVAAHARYQNESMVPSVDIAHSGFGFQLASYYGAEN